MRILVTGAAGFIASHLCEKLHSLGHEVVGIDNINDYYDVNLKELNAKDLADKGIHIHRIDLNSNLSVVKHFASLGAGADCVSIGEVRRALMAGIPKYKILFSGVGKRDDEIREAIEADILYGNDPTSHEQIYKSCVILIYIPSKFSIVLNSKSINQYIPFTNIKSDEDEDYKFSKKSFKCKHLN